MTAPISTSRTADKLCSELIVGDRIWMNGMLLRVTEILPATGNIVRFKTMAILPRGLEVPMDYSGLSYGTARVEVDEERRTVVDDRRSA